MGAGCRAVVLATLAVAAAAFVPYAATLGHDLVWDDAKLVAMTRLRLEEGGLRALLSAPFQLEPDVPLGYYRPVVLLTFWWDGSWPGHPAAAYHATNVALHVLCSLLVLALARAAGAALGPAAAGALIFAVHPVHVESVAFVSGRTDLLAALFALAAATVRLRAPRARAAPVAGAVAFLLAALSKETALMLPLVLLAWDALGARERPAAETSWWSRNGVWIVGWGAAIGVVAVLRFAVAGVGFVERAGSGRIAWRELPAVAAWNARLLVAPWPLNARYPDQAPPTDLAALAAALVLIAALAITATRRHKRAGAKGAIWIAAFLLPTLRLVPIPVPALAERYLYLPSAGIALAIALAAWPARAAVRRTAAAVAAAIVVLFGALATVRSRVWKDEVRLFENVVRTSPDYVEGATNLARAYGMRGEHAKALAVLEEALRRDPSSAPALHNLGCLFGELGRHEEAIACFRRAIAIQGNFPDALVNLATAHLSLGRFGEAFGPLAEALRLNPGHAQAWDTLGAAYQAVGRYAEAVDAHERALTFDDRLAGARVNLGHALLGAGRPAEAGTAFARVVADDPASAAGRHGLALAALALDHVDEAIRRGDELRALDPAMADDVARRIRSRGTGAAIPPGAPRRDRAPRPAGPEGPRSPARPRGSRRGPPRRTRAA